MQRGKYEYLGPLFFLPPWRGKGLTALRRRSRAKVRMGGESPVWVRHRSSPPPWPSPVKGEGMCCSPYSSLLLLLVVLCLPVSGQAASPYQAVQQGNALYQSGKYAEAAEQY